MSTAIPVAAARSMITIQVKHLGPTDRCKSNRWCVYVRFLRDETSISLAGMRFIPWYSAEVDKFELEETLLGSEGHKLNPKALHVQFTSISSQMAFEVLHLYGAKDLIPQLLATSNTHKFSLKRFYSAIKRGGKTVIDINTSLATQEEKELVETSFHEPATKSLGGYPSVTHPPISSSPIVGKLGQKIDSLTHAIEHTREWTRGNGEGIQEVKQKVQTLDEKIDELRVLLEIHHRQFLD